MTLLRVSFHIHEATVIMRCQVVDHTTLEVWLKSLQIHSLHAKKLSNMSHLHNPFSHLNPVQTTETVQKL